MKYTVKPLTLIKNSGLFVLAMLMLSACTDRNAVAGNPTPSAVLATKSASSATVAVTLQPAATKAASITGLTIVHSVQQDENLYHIARQYGTSVQAISQANGITDSTFVTVGQKLIIPNISATTEPEPTATPTGVRPTLGPALAPTP